jgi:hypothetical protein
VGDDDDATDDDDDATGDDDDDAVDDDDSASVDDDDSASVDDDDAVDTCAAAVPCLGAYDIQNSLDLDAFALCESISGDLRFVSQAWLTSVDLPCLTAVGGNLQIVGNNALTDISGLSNLTSVGERLNFYGNRALCQSLVDAFVAACTVGGSVLDITGNDSGC